MPFAHLLNKGLFEAAVVNQARVVEIGQESEKILPYLELLCDVICPEAVVNEPHWCSYACSDEIIKVAIWNRLHVKINGSSFYFDLRFANDVDFLFSDCESL